MNLRHAALILPFSCMLACGSKPGTLHFTIYGEEYIEQGIPAEDFVDGWEVTFSKFLISVGQLRAASGHDDAALEDPAYRVFDLAQSSAGAGHAVLSAQVPGGAYDHVGYRVAPPPQDAKLGNAAAADLDRLRQGGYAIYVEGIARKGAAQKTFRWSFSDTTTYDGCHSTAVVDGGDARSQITIHADHLFYDDLFAAEPNVAFELIASADHNSDGEVTQPELAMVDLSTQARYQVGSIGIRDLGSFIAYQIGTLGHIDGEGHCETATRE